MYTAKTIATHENGRGWKTITVGVFDGESLVGSYERNYPSMNNTFWPFQQGDKWYALYSPHYMYTRVMSLPDCKDLGGEDAPNTPYKDHFCPTDYYVPELTCQRLTPDDPAPNVGMEAERWAVVVDGVHRFPGHPANPHSKEDYDAAIEAANALYDRWQKRNPFVTRHAAWGFVGGCVWGDDHSTKVHWLDLSQVSDGIIKRDQRFGYLELHDGVSLKDGISVDSIDDANAPLEEMVITVAVPKRFNLRGTPVE